MSKKKFLVGLIGGGIQESLSPALHEQEARSQGINLHYQLIDLARDKRGVADLPRLLESAEAAGFDGLNVTHPCKQAVLPLLHELSEDARAIGAVNTVVFRDGKRMGFNTDCPGFAKGFRQMLPDVPIRSVVLLGAGGAGAAVAHAAMALDVGELAILDRDHQRAEALVRSVTAQYPGRRVHATRDLAAAMAQADGLIHATPTGMKAYPGLPLDRTLLRSELWVAEVVYFPLKTDLLRAAEALGCRCMDGGAMMVWQAVEAFEHFTGITPNAARMEKYFRQIVAQQAGG